MSIRWRTIDFAPFSLLLPIFVCLVSRRILSLCMCGVRTVNNDPVSLARYLAGKINGHIATKIFTLHSIHLCTLPHAMIRTPYLHINCSSKIDLHSFASAHQIPMGLDLCVCLFHFLLYFSSTFALLLCFYWHKYLISQSCYSFFFLLFYVCLMAMAGATFFCFFFGEFPPNRIPKVYFQIDNYQRLEARARIY